MKLYEIKRRNQREEKISLIHNIFMIYTSLTNLIYNKEKKFYLQEKLY